MFSFIYSEDQNVQVYYMFLIFNTLKLGARVRLLLSDEVCY